MKCPGQDTAYWKPGSIYEIPCPQCGTLIEFFKDDATRKCKKCSYSLVNPKLDFGCAAYCQHVDNCMETLPKKFVLENKFLFKNRFIKELNKHFGKKITESKHIKTFVEYAKNICKREVDCDLSIVLCLSYLYNIKPSISKKEKGQLIRKILDNLGAQISFTNEICNIILSKRDFKKNKNFKVIHDTNIIVSIKNKLKNKKKINLDVISKQFLTHTGLEEAKKILEK